MVRPSLILITLSLWAQVSQAQIEIGSNTTFSFASVDEGRRVLTATDDFVLRMSPFDRGARLKTDGDVSQEDYLEFVGSRRVVGNTRLR